MKKLLKIEPEDSNSKIQINRMIERMKRKPYAFSENNQLDIKRTFHKYELKNIGIPPRALERLQNLTTTRALQSTQRWMKCEKADWALILSSGEGTGKSTAAALWLREMALSGKISTSRALQKHWWTAPEISAESIYNPNMELLCNIHCLVLDDLGSEFIDNKGLFNAKIDRIIDSRYRNYRKTIITTNLPRRLFAERYGPRTNGRLKRSEGAIWDEWNGKSLRE